MCSVFLDLSKAFDKVPHVHVPLLAKRADQNYLCLRSRVDVSGENSALMHAISGVPQGSVWASFSFY